MGTTAEVTIPPGAVIYLYLGENRIGFAACKKPGTYPVDTTYYDMDTLKPLYYCRHLSQPHSHYGEPFDNWRVNVDGIIYRHIAIK